MTEVRERPNFLLIMTDTQGADMVGAYQPDAGLQTPCLDALAATGTRFERAYTAAPMCTPARATLLTGLDPTTSGAWANSVGLSGDAVTLGHRLQQEGYDTAYIGKWHLDGTNYYGDGICPPGWNPAYWYDGRRYVDDLGRDDFELWRSGLRSASDLREHEITAEFTMAHRVTERALRFLDRQPRDKPFLLVVSYDEPHEPFTCPAEYAEQFLDYWYPIGPSTGDGLARKPEHHREWAGDSDRSDGIARAKWGEQYGGEVREGRFRHPLYFGCNSFVDAQIGRVVGAVRDRTGDRTVITHTSDHGTMKGGHRLLNKGPAMYEELIRVPLIVSGPSDLVATGTVSEPVSHYDLVPTILQLADVRVPKIMTGRSLRSLLNDSTGEAADRTAAIFVQYNKWSGPHQERVSYRGLFPIRAVVQDRWKLVVNVDGQDELYDLDHDPVETNNMLAADSGSDATNVAEPLLQLLLERMEKTDDPFRGPQWADRSWRTKASLQ